MKGFHGWLLQRNAAHSVLARLPLTTFGCKPGYGQSVSAFMYCFFIATLLRLSCVGGVSARVLDLSFLVGYFQFALPTPGPQASCPILMLQQIHEAETQ